MAKMSGTGTHATANNDLGFVMVSTNTFKICEFPSVITTTSNTTDNPAHFYWGTIAGGTLYGPSIKAEPFPEPELEPVLVNSIPDLEPRRQITLKKR